MIPEKGLFVGGRGILARLFKALIIGVIVIGLMLILSYAALGIGAQFGKAITLRETFRDLSAFGFYFVLILSLLAWVFNPPKGKK